VTPTVNFRNGAGTNRARIAGKAAVRLRSRQDVGAIARNATKLASQGQKFSRFFAPFVNDSWLATALTPAS
jgi:hypothetical protein